MKNFLDGVLNYLDWVCTHTSVFYMLVLEIPGLQPHNIGTLCDRTFFN